MTALIFLMLGLFFMLGVSIVLCVHHYDKQKKLAREQHAQLHDDATFSAPKVVTLTQTQAEVQGERDMIRAWLDFNCPPVWDPRPKMTSGVRDLMDNHPPMDAGKHVLTGYLTDCRLAIDAATKNGYYSALVETMRAVSARLYLLTEDEFQSASGATSVKFLSHDDPAVAEAYIRGQLAGVEKIKGDVILAKERARTYEQRRLGISETSRSHDATLEALREQARPQKTEQEAWMERFHQDDKAVE